MNKDQLYLGSLDGILELPSTFFKTIRAGVVKLMLGTGNVFACLVYWPVIAAKLG